MKIFNHVFFVLALLAGRFALADQIWIDVRSVEEYTTDHIDGDANVPLADINVDALAAKYGKDAELMLYCRSGNRAGQAKQLLETAGFTKVTNAGGIDAVRKLRDIAAPNSSPAVAAPANHAEHANH